MIPVRNKNTDISSEVAAGKKFQNKVKTLAENVASQSINKSRDLDEVIAEVSKKEKFNRIQIQRLVEESNTVAYNKRYDKLRDSNDRRITFPVASLNGVVEKMGSDAPKEVINPNLASGKQGEGELSKAASTEEFTYIHHPNARLKEREERYLSKVASAQKRQDNREKTRKEKEHQSTIFKIANSLAMSERQYKNGNQVFNTMLSDVSLLQEDIDGIKKKASEIGEQLVKTKRSHSGFMVTLKENPIEKVASHVLGDYSLLKEAEQSNKVEEVKVQPTEYVSDFNQLINLARKLQAGIQPENSTGSEVN